MSPVATLVCEVVGDFCFLCMAMVAKQKRFCFNSGKETKLVYDFFYEIYNLLHG